VNLSACGLDSAADIRRPAVSWDATTIAFAAREHATDPLAIYTIKADGSGCAKQTDIAAHDAMGNGLLEHDFDPTFSPPAADGKERIVFASTRGNIAPGDGNFSYHGPQRTPEDPSKPNANLYAWDPSSSASNHVRQLTYQLDMERLPSFMSDGRLIFTAEKREPEFYQLALRRQNLDGADYHPLYGQRASIGYTQATGVVELADKDFATIFSNGNATHGGGAIAVFNRSIGIDFTSTQPGDYLVDPSVIDPNSPASPEPDFFLHSLSVVANDGAYTSPAPLPDGKMLVSWASGDPTSPSFGGAYDVYVLDPSTGMKAMLVHNAGASSLDAVAIYERAPKGIFQSTTDEPNGHVEIRPNENDADITVLDMRVLGSLLFQNTPTGRPVEPDLGGFEIWEEMPPDVNGVKSIQDCGNNAYKDAYGQVCVNRRLVGHVSVQGDGSAHFKIPGGMPMVLHLDDDGTSRQKKLIRWQREAMTFVPGEYTHQGFPQGFFNNLCGTCHGSISGQPIDAALKPDFLTQASNVAVLDPAQGMLDLADFSDPNGMRGAVQGPPANP
jgi:hypothetical protein